MFWIPKLSCIRDRKFINDVRDMKRFQSGDRDRFLAPLSVCSLTGIHTYYQYLA